MFVTPGQLFGGGRQRQLSVHEDFLLSGKTAVFQFNLEATVTSGIKMDLDIVFCEQKSHYVYIYIHSVYIYICGYIVYTYMHSICI